LLAIYLPFFAVFASTNTSEQKIGASILSPVAFSLGLSQMLLYQSNFTPLNSKSLGEMYQNYSMAACLGMLIFDSVLYLFLAWYDTLFFNYIQLLYFHILLLSFQVL
jgi:hypothetical protein